ncbi:ribosomal L7Ae/L30e/S12e/Gadd45 family protein [Clostridium sp. 19966]|uniref:ribosomal L7Ae/L30e/S12e/Gadd45 family protein n=1 Tax=Clostridium sp. 19966 TaxID=2768166 RepID=UPI0028DF860A|nr:ribosomal L7Ae/L30e/S12e/Gadd45 family protein [Clostridium sp. 19966]MDT8716420.1 ribosomal L7Ae/L30e/S12e/Gadd45 family protein [Clostridium sp. 19966]
MKDKFLNFLGIAKRSGNLVLGYNKCFEKIKASKVFLCILAEDVSINTFQKFNLLASKNNIKVILGYSSIELGESVGCERISIICVMDKNMACNLVDLQDKQKISGVNICPK